MAKSPLSLYLAAPSPAGAGAAAAEVTISATDVKRGEVAKRGESVKCYESVTRCESMTLESANVTVVVKDMVAEVEFCHVYRNNSPQWHLAHHLFLLDPRAAVTGLSLHASTSTSSTESAQPPVPAPAPSRGRGLGKVLSKVQAREEFQKAVRKGRPSALLEQQQPAGTFLAQVGPIAPCGGTASLTLRYVTELQSLGVEAGLGPDDAGDSLMLVLPVVLPPSSSSAAPFPVEMETAAKGGAATLPPLPPTVGLLGASGRSEMDVTVQVQCSAGLSSISSPSHPHHVHLLLPHLPSRPQEKQDLGHSDPAMAALDSVPMDADLLLVFRTHGPVEPLKGPEEEGGGEDEGQRSQGQQEKTDGEGEAQGSTGPVAQQAAGAAPAAAAELVKALLQQAEEGASSRSTPLHCLAARDMIMGQEQGLLVAYESSDTGVMLDAADAISRLALAFGVASSQTSFVIVCEEEEEDAAQKNDVTDGANGQAVAPALPRTPAVTQFLQNLNLLSAADTTTVGLLSALEAGSANVCSLVHRRATSLSLATGAALAGLGSKAGNVLSTLPQQTVLWRSKLPITANLADVRLHSQRALAGVQSGMHHCYTSSSLSLLHLGSKLHDTASAAAQGGAAKFSALSRMVAATLTAKAVAVREVCEAMGRQGVTFLKNIAWQAGGQVEGTTA